VRKASSKLFILFLDFHFTGRICRFGCIKLKVKIVLKGFLPNCPLLTSRVSFRKSLTDAI
jgi:hypothetical protein